MGVSRIPSEEEPRVRRGAPAGSDPEDGARGAAEAPRAGGGPFARLLRRASAVDLLNAAFLAFVVVLTAAAFARTPFRAEAVGVYLGLVAVLYATGRLRASSIAPGLRAGALFAMTILFLFVVFESLTFVMPYLRPFRCDEALAGVDHGVFGCHPTAWLERWKAPWLTDAMYVLYLFYFPMPLFVLVPMVVRRKYASVDRWMFTLLVCYLGAYATYFAFPAEGPRSFLASVHAGPLDGVAVAAPIRGLIDALEPNKLDAFPSLHAAILSLTMVLAWQHARRTFWAFVPVAAGILLSLVYLRYHYVVDVVAGLVWSALAYALAAFAYPRLRALASPHFGADS